MCDKKVFTLLTTVPYGTEVLNHCSALTRSIPARPPPALRLLPATPAAHMIGGFSGESTQTSSCGIFFFLSCHSYAPVHK